MKTLREQLTFNQANIQVLEESGPDGHGKNLYLKGICIEGNKRNANDRIYPMHEISKAVNTINEQIKSGNSVLGEVDHPDDLKIDTFKSSGAGGQHVNKTSSAVRITHKPTGIVIACQQERSQFQNKENALKLLQAQLYQLEEQKQKSQEQKLKGEYKQGSWGNQIRSYVFQPYQMVKDHRTGAETSAIEKVVDGDLDLFIEKYLEWQANKH